VFVRVDGQQLQVCLSVFVIEKNRGAVVAALGDVVGISWGDDASDSWHRGRLSKKEVWCNKKIGECPEFAMLEANGRLVRLQGVTRQIVPWV
jgi:hypothetical protein